MKRLTPSLENETLNPKTPKPHLIDYLYIIYVLVEKFKFWLKFIILS